MMRIIFVVILIGVFCNFLNAQEINENAKKYLNILAAKPSPGFMFERFYGAWMESSDTKALEEFLKKTSIETPSSENFLLLAFYYQKEGQINQALGVFNSIENAKLLTGDVLFYRAKLESNALNFTDSIKHIDTAISMPLKEELKQKLLKLKAQVQYRSGDSAGARKTFEVLLAINEKDKLIIEDVMEIQLSEGIYEDAKKYCQKLIDLAADNYEKVNYQLKMASILKRLNDSANSEKIYLQLINLSGQDSWLLKEVVYQFESIYRGKDNLTDLIIKYEEIIKSNPQNVYLRKRYSSLLSEKGEKESAINEFKAIVELLPGDRPIKEEYAGLLVSNGKTEEAIKILEGFANPKTGSKDYEIILSIAELEFKIKKVAEAYQRIEQFLSKGDLTEYEILRVSNLVHKHDQGAKEVELLEKYSKEKPEAIGLKEALVNLYLEGKEKEKALQVIKTLNLSDDMDLNFRIANQFTKHKLQEDAIAILQATKKENKETYKYYKRLYDIYSELKNEEKKKEISNSILKVCNSFVEIREAIQLIKGLHEEKELDDAIKVLEAKKDLDFKELLLLAHFKYKANLPELAFKLIEDSNLKFSNELLFMELKENFFSSIKEFEKAIQVVDELIKKSPKDSTKYLLIRTNLQKRAGNTDEAIASAKQLIVATNNKVEHVIMLAELYQQKGEADDAIAVLRKASFENAEEKSIKVKLADSYMYAQNYNDARRILWSLLEATEDITEKISYMDKIFNCYDYDLGVDALIENLKERKLNNTKSTFPLLALIRVYQRLNDTENKSKYMIELSQLKTDDVRLYLELADVMAKDLNYEGAETALKKAVEIDKSELARNKLIKYYFSVDKDEQAIMELLRVSKNSFKEVEVVEIAEKYIASEKYEKAYQFMKSHNPTDRTEVFDYVFAVAGREAKIENAEALFYRLLDKNEEFAKAQAVQPQNYNYYADDKFLPKLYKKLNEFQGALWSYSSYQIKQQTGGHMNRYAGSVPANIIIRPTNLKELHNFAIAHLGDMYRAAEETKKTEILNELKNRNIEYAEVLLMMDKNKINSGNDSTYKDLYNKSPDNIELKILSALSDRTFFNKVDEKLLPLVNEIKEKDKNLAFWLLSLYSAYLKEIKQEMVSEIELLMTALNVPEDTKLNLYVMLFANINNRPKIIAEDLIEKYKPIILSLLDKSIEKDFAGLRNGSYYILPLLVKFKDAERYAKIINKQLSSNKTKNRNQNQYYYGRSTRNRNMGKLSGGADFPFIVYQQIMNQYYELYNRNNTIMDEEFRKQLLPLIENKYLKLSMYHFLQNEEESEKLIKDFEESKTLDDLQIVASYYGFKNKDKEAIVALNKALVLATTVDSKKSINGRIAFYAAKIDDPIIKTDGINAAKRLKNFNLSKEELLELSILLESLGESSEAEKLDDKISKMNTVTTNTRNSYNNVMQTLGSKLDSMLGSEKNEAGFKLLISSMKMSFVGFSGQMKTSQYFQFDAYNFNQIMKMIKKKNVSAEFKKFVSDQTSLNEDDLVTIVFILYRLDEISDAIVFAKKLMDKKPNELTYKMLGYVLNFKNTSELEESLKKEIVKNPVDVLFILRNFWGNSRLFETNRYELKPLWFYILDNVTFKEQNTDLFTEVFIGPFLSGATLSKNIYTESILNTRSKKKDLKKDDKILLDNYYKFFEDVMLKCIKNKMAASVASSSLLHYYVVNQLPISNDLMQVFSEAAVTNYDSTQSLRYIHYSSNGESLLPLRISLAIHLLNQNKGAELDAICEKITGDEKEKFKKTVDKLKILYSEKPITKADLNELSESIDNNNYRNDSVLTILSKLLQKVEVKNSQVHEFLLASLKEEFSQEVSNFYMDQNAFSKYIGNQLKTLKSDEAVNYLLNIEKKILPKPFDSELFKKNKNNWDHFSKKIINLFSFDQMVDFDLEMIKKILFAAQKSEFYFYITRSSENYFWKMRELSVDEILASGLFTGNLSEIQIVMVDRDSFLIGTIIRKLKENKKQETIEKLAKLEQTDGVKLLTYWLEGKSYQKVFDLLGSKINEFNSMPMTQKVEWAGFLADLYKSEISSKDGLSDLGKEFKSLIENLSNNKIEETKKKFLDEKFEDEMDSYQFLELLTGVYPSILSESEEKVLTTIKSAKRKYKFYERNSSRNYSDNYLHDEFVNKLIQIDSPKKNHLVVATELLSQNLKWPPEYYREYSSIVRLYMKQRIFDLIDKLGIKKNKNGKFVLDTEQEKAFKLELNAAINDVVAINKNSVPIYMVSFGEVLGPINGKETALNELIAEWGAEKELSTLKKDIYFEFKAFMKKDESILENHFLSIINNPEVIAQIKTFYIESILKNSKLSKEAQKVILAQQLNMIVTNSVKFTENPNQFYQLIEKYDYETLKESPEEVSKVVKIWYRSFEKAILESFDNDWKIERYGAKDIYKIDTIRKLILLMKNHLEEKMVAKFFSTPKLGFKTYLPCYMLLIKEGFGNIVLETLNGNIEEIKINLNRMGDQFLVAEDLKIIENFIEKITDEEKRNFARIMFYRIGVKNEKEDKNLNLFTNSVKEMIKQPIKNSTIKRKLLELLLGTELSEAKEVIQLINNSNEPFDENKLKTLAYQEIGTSFRLYCAKFSKALVDNGIEQFKKEVDKTLANIKENESDKDKLILTISDSLAEDLLQDKNIIKNGNAYFDAITHVLDEFGHADEDGQTGFNSALCLLFLNNKADQYSVIIERYAKQHVYHWEKKLSTVKAIQLFKTAYLQNPEQSAGILKSINEFFSSKANSYYDYLSENKTKKLFDFIPAEADRNQVIENYKKFNQENKNKKEDE